jgi:DeoR/GlpR family transcriptional regulator of sugar metabolism
MYGDAPSGATRQPDAGKPHVDNRHTPGPAPVTSLSSSAAREDRIDTIAKFVLVNGTATAAELVELTGVSLMTVHRDLDELERRGMVRKHRGGVSALASTVFESNHEYRMRTSQAVKNAIAARALQFIEPGMSLMLDDSTTVLALARLLERIQPLTVVTNYLANVEILRSVRNIRLIVVGGEYAPSHHSFVGSSCVDAIQGYSVDAAFISTSAMDAARTYHQEQEEIVLKRAMIKSGRQKFLLIDSTKMPRTALYQLLPVRDFDFVIVNDVVDTELVNALREQVHVEIATVTGTSSAMRSRSLGSKPETVPDGLGERGERLTR